MSIFRRETTSESPPSLGGPSESTSGSSPKRRLTHIAAGTRLQGEISGATEVLVDGEVAGQVRVEAPVVVGTEGVVEGPITAPVVRVGGRVVGDVQATDRVEVLATGGLEGNISAPRVVISEGAFFKGRIEMTKAKESPPPKAKPAPEPAGS
ncbi:MAG TPA: polymer-forming cytoskeletal protein [Thermoanaerobaculia bacterium]|jgi:cytoskeletal protein CcmA (bactofilin family)|nr:polymer-forming cytoskeletal protein [Thermoanaerobaculia bacterium]